MGEASNGSKLVEALAKARAEMPALKFDKENPHFKNRFASLAAHLDCAVPALSKHGLAVTQTTALVGETCVLVTTLRHSSGESVEGVYPVVPSRPGPQEMGSALTYARRYTLASILGLAGEDDGDGNAAAKPTNGEPTPAKDPKSKPVPPKPAKTFAEMSPPGQVYSLSRAAGLTSKEAVAKFCGSILGREMIATKDGQQVPSIGSVTADEAALLCKELRAIAKVPAVSTEGRAA